LFFAGGTDANGVEHAIANPAGDVLAELNAQVPGANGQAPAGYSLVGSADHAVSCLSYDGAKLAEDPPAAEALRASELTIAERERVDAALPLAQLLLNPANGIVRTGVAASRDQPGAGAIAFYLEPAAYAQAAASIPAFIGGVATVLLPANGPSGEPVAPPDCLSTARRFPDSGAGNAKQRIAASLLKSNPAIFGVGVGQSLDNPSDAALMLFVDEKKFTGNPRRTSSNCRLG
jgi:hypothetical protein